MAIAAFYHPPSLTHEQYDEVMSRLERAGLGSPDGRLHHVCFELNGKLHIYDLWDSQENLDRFTVRLMPVLNDLGLDPGTPDLASVYSVVEGK